MEKKASLLADKPARQDAVAKAEEGKLKVDVKRKKEPTSGQMLWGPHSLRGLGWGAWLSVQRKERGTGILVPVRVQSCMHPPTTLPGPSTPLAVPTPSPLGEPSPGGTERVSKPGFAREQESITLGPKMSLGTFGSLPRCWEGCVSKGGVSWGGMGLLTPMGNTEKQEWVIVPMVIQNS